MAQVSEAERWVNGYCGKTFTAGAAPDGVETAVLNLARFYMTQQMFEDGHIKEMPFTLEDVLTICRDAIEDETVDIDYAGIDFDLRNMLWW